MLGAWKDASTVEGLVLTIEQLTGAANIKQSTGYVGIGVAHPNDPDPPAVAVTISPSETSGTSFHKVTAKLPIPVEEGGGFAEDDGIVRISTHDGISKLYAGERTVQMFSGESDRVITVYAQFTEISVGELEDVSGHPFLKYDVADSAIAMVDSEGRIHAIGVGSTTIGVQTWDDRCRVTVALTVRKALDSGLDAPRIESLVRQTASQTATVYVLAEGYVDGNRFFMHARKVIKKWLETRPYKYFASRYNVIGVFQPSSDRGATIGPRIGAQPRDEPTSTRSLWEGNLPLPTGIMLNRDTLFGLSFGSRTSTSVLKWFRDRAPSAAQAVFYQRGRHEWRAIRPDERRLPRFGLDDPAGFKAISPNAGFASFIRRYISAAGFTVKPDDRVVFLIDDDLVGGLHVDVEGIPAVSPPTVTASVGRKAWITNVVAAGALLDRTISGASLDEANAGALLAHELAHTYALGDEYEDNRKRTHSAINSRMFERYENIQHDISLRLAGNSNPLRGDPSHVPPLPAGVLDVKRIKWNIHRVAKISPASQIAVVSGHYRLTLARGQASRWGAGERAFLRNSLLVPKDVRLEPRTTAISIQVITTDLNHDTVDVQVPAGFDIATLGPRPLLYVAKTNSHGAELALIDPAVLAFLGTNGPFPKGQPCLDGDPDHYNDDRACPPIPNFSRPSNHADAIGLYEGGGNYSCDVYRPAGRCKMRKWNDTVIESTTGPAVIHRTEIVGFCFVCSYILVDRIDATQHERLEKDYPRDC
jgi:hypothetical protein